MKRTYLKYITALLLFGLNGIVASFIELDSYEIVLLRTMIGSLLLILLFFLTRGKLTFWRHKKQFVFLAISGIAMGSAGFFSTRPISKSASAWLRSPITAVP